MRGGRERDRREWISYGRERIGAGEVEEEGRVEREEERRLSEAEERKEAGVMSANKDEEEERLVCCGRRSG
jgi:hypothetical protein